MRIMRGLRRRFVREREREGVRQQRMGEKRAQPLAPAPGVMPVVWTGTFPMSVDVQMS